MVSTYTSNKKIEQPSFNSYVDTWDVPVNNDWAIIDLALGGSVSINTTGLSGNQTLAQAQYQPLKIVLTGTPTAAINYRVPSGVGGLWVVRNNTSGGFAVTVDSIAGGSAVTIPAASNTLVSCDGTASGMFLAINTPPAAAGSTTQVQFNSAGVLGGSANLTWDGTTLTATGLSVTGATAIGDAAGDVLTINGIAVTIPNGLNFGSNNWVVSAGKVGVGLAAASLGSEIFTAAGTIFSTAGGFKFPDNTTQTSAAATVAGSNTQLQYNDGGVFGGSSRLTYNKTTHVMDLNGAMTIAETLGVTGAATFASTLGITGALSLTIPLAVTSGGTGGSTATGSGALVRADSPALIGTPTAPTATVGDADTSIATTAFVAAAVALPFKAKAYITVSGGVATVEAGSINITSVTRTSSGHFAVVMTNAVSGSYVVLGFTTATIGSAQGTSVFEDVNSGARSSTTFNIGTAGDNVGFQDPNALQIMVF